MSPTCEQCKDFLSENRVSNKSDYFKWSVTNHPNKFIQYGSDDARYKEATRKTSSMNDCYSRWYGNNPSCFRDNECVICLTEFENPSDAVTVCRNHHRFHRECIDNWIRSGNSTCPTCRSTLTYTPARTPAPVIPSISSRTPTPVIPSISSRTSPITSRATLPISSRTPLPRAPPATSRIASPIMSSSYIPPILRRSKTRKSCKSGYKRNKSTGRCRKSCKSGYKRNKSTGRCRKTKSRKSGYKKNKSTRRSRKVRSKKSCKSGYKRNKSTGRCRKIRSKKSCESGYKRNKSTGRCRKVRSKKSKRSRFVDNAAMGECRSRKKRVCKNDPNCTYRSGVGCVKRKGAKKSPFSGPIMSDISF